MAVRSWVTSPWVRHFPLAPVRRPKPPRIEVALNERFSVQVALRSTGEPREVRLEADAPDGWSVRVRRVGLVPVAHHGVPIEPDPLDTDGLGHIPGFVPDPLFDEDTLLLPPNETHAFWITVRPGHRARPGKHRIRLAVLPDGEKATTHTLKVRLHDVRLKPRVGFPITHWFYCDALMDHYGCDGFDRRFWHVLPGYVKNVTGHGLDTLYVPVFTPPLDGVKRPSQLLRVKRNGKDKYRFDWRDVARYIRLARRNGVRHFEWCHPFTQWGAKFGVRVYEGQGRDEKLLWPPSTRATSKRYRTFLGEYLPQLHRFCTEHKILKRSFFHVSDEPHGAEHLVNYRKVRTMLDELAPWMKVMDALSEIEFGRAGLTDMPIPSTRTALDFLDEGIESWVYYCCGPRGRFINRLMDTPLAKIAMHGLLFYRWPFRGFLHWGYNYWYASQTRRLIDPFTEQAGCRWPNWPPGDPFQVYPGPDGPIDSIRWEVFGESLQDYQLLQALEVSRDDPLLASIRSFADFPKTAAWRQTVRRALFARASNA